MNFAQGLIAGISAVGIGFATYWVIKCIRAVRSFITNLAIQDFYDYKDTRVLKNVEQVYRGKGVFHVEPVRGNGGTVYDFSRWEKDGDLIGIYISDEEIDAVDEFILPEVEVFRCKDGFTVWRAPPDSPVIY